jgi:hypothetical protein
MLRVTAEYLWVPPGTAGTLLGQAQADNPGYGATLTPGDVGAAQRLIMRVAEAVAGGAAPANTDFQDALNAAAADLYTRLGTANAEPGYGPGTPFSIIQNWATGAP